MTNQEYGYTVLGRLYIAGVYEFDASANREGLFSPVVTYTFSQGSGASAYDGSTREHDQTQHPPAIGASGGLFSSR